MSLQRVTELLKANRTRVIDRLASRIVGSVPRYALGDARDLRDDLDSLFDDLMEVVDRSDTSGFVDRIVGISAKRIAQGFAPSDYLKAVLLVFPGIRESIRQLGPQNDPGFAEGFARLESVLHELAGTTVNIFIDSVQRQLESKNRELNRLNQELRAHQQALSAEARDAGRKLELANEFNRRVIDSLSSGLFVVDTAGRVALYTSRLEEIIGLPAEQVLGRDITEAFRSVMGLEPESLVRAVRLQGRLPMTRISVTLGNGRKRTVYVRAERMYDSAGSHEGTVVVVDDVTERELLLDSFSRYVSRDLVQRLLARAEPLGLGGERRFCTALFADVRGFTRLSEMLPAERLHELLNQYFRVMIESITRCGGFIDKFVGDKVMALFTTDREPASTAVAALRSALDLKGRIAQLNGERALTGGAPLDVGIGINSGEVLLGNVGSEERMDFTAIGDPVNVADRLQSMARGGEVLVGEATAGLVGDAFPLQDLGMQAIKGREAPVRVFELKLPKTC